MRDFKLGAAREIRALKRCTVEAVIDGEIDNESSSILEDLLERNR